MRNIRLSCLVCIILIGVFVLTGCGNSKINYVEGKVNVVTSFYPLYDFTLKIGGNHVHAINLIPTGVEPHDWTPKSNDMKHISKADLFVYNGAGLEGWVDDFLKSLDSDSETAVIEASYGIELINSGHGQFDPHVWLSPLQAQIMANNIKDGLIQADAQHKEDYEANYENFIAQLDELDAKYREVVNQALRKEIVVSHEAVGYLARDYGLTQIAVMGLSPEAEPTAQDLKHISAFIREQGVKYILFEELVSSKLADVLASDLNIDTLVFNPLEGLTEEQREAGEDYISLMEGNLSSLKTALE